MINSEEIRIFPKSMVQYHVEMNVIETDRNI